MNAAVALRRAALLARIGAAGPEGVTLAELLEDPGSAHLAAPFSPSSDPVRGRELQAQSARNDLKFIAGLYDFRQPAIERAPNRGGSPWRNGGGAPVRRRAPPDRRVIETARCLCGCGSCFPRLDPWGRPRQFVAGHNRKRYPSVRPGSRRRFALVRMEVPEPQAKRLTASLAARGLFRSVSTARLLPGRFRAFRPYSGRVSIEWSEPEALPKAKKPRKRQGPKRAAAGKKRFERHAHSDGGARTEVVWRKAALLEGQVLFAP